MQVPLLLILLVLYPWVVSGTHFRFGTISWKQLPGGESGRLVEFTLESAWRKSYFAGGSFFIGDTVTEHSTFLPDVTDPSIEYNLDFTVNTINEVEDWFIGTTVLTHEYAGDGDFTAEFLRCCRISSLINNPDADFRLSTGVSVTAGSQAESPRTTTLPIITAIVGEPLDSVVSVSHSDTSQPLSFRLATAEEAARPDSQVTNTLYSQIEGLALDGLSGRLSWTPSLTGLYSTQVVISTPHTFIVTDFLFQVIDNTEARCIGSCVNSRDPCVTSYDCYGCSASHGEDTCVVNSAPVFSEILADSESIPVAPVVSVDASYLTPLTLRVSASDADMDDTVTIYSTSLPTGATLSSTPGNPGSVLLQWTPSGSTDSFLICFTAEDSFGNSAPGQVCVTLRVSSEAIIATGDGLTFSVAGRRTEVSFTNSAGRPHTVSITGAVTTA